MATKKTAKKTTKKAAKKTTAKAVKEAAKKMARKAGSASSAKTAPTEAEIRLAAYFLFLERRQTSFYGDACGDWLEARRRLAS